MQSAIISTSGVRATTANGPRSIGLLLLRAGGMPNEYREAKVSTDCSGRFSAFHLANSFRLELDREPGSCAHLIMEVCGKLNSCRI